MLPENFHLKSSAPCYSTGPELNKNTFFIISKFLKKVSCIKRDIMSKYQIMINISAVLKSCISTKMLIHLTHINDHLKNNMIGNKTMR